MERNHSENLNEALCIVKHSKFLNQVRFMILKVTSKQSPINERLFHKHLHLKRIFPGPLLLNYFFLNDKTRSGKYEGTTYKTRE